MTIDAEKFRTVFSSEWLQMLDEDEEEMLVSFKKDSTWTPKILGDNGLLKKMSNVFDREYKHRFGREWYTLDAVFVSGKDLFRSGRNYPSEVLTIIEHENGPNVEEEMWKLIHWRSPLKVLIFYGYPESSNDSRKDWANNKAQDLWKMLDTVNEFHEESRRTEYLFLVGSLGDRSRLPEWQWATSDHRDLCRLNGN